MLYLDTQVDTYVQEILVARYLEHISLSPVPGAALQFYTLPQTPLKKRVTRGIASSPYVSFFLLFMFHVCLCYVMLSCPGLQIYGGHGSLSHDFKIWPITFQGSGPSGAIIYGCENISL